MSTPPASRRWAVRIGGAAVVVLSVGLVAAAVRGFDADAVPTGEGRLEPKGRVLVTHAGQTAKAVGGSVGLRAGDSVEVINGSAVVRLAGAGQRAVELRPGSTARFDSGPELTAGDLLATTTTDPVTVRVNGSEVAVGTSSAAKVASAPGLRVSAYRGATVVHSGGYDLDVPALRATSVAAVGLVSSTPTPIVLDQADAWDVRFLGDVLDRTADLEARARGLTANIDPTDAGSVDFYRHLLPALESEPEFQQAAIDPARPAGDQVVGTAIAILGARGRFAERLRDAFAFRDQGASWALVALDQQVPSLTALVNLLDGAVNSSPSELALAPPTLSPQSEAPPATFTPRPTTPTATTTPTTTAPVTTTTAPRSTPTTTTPTTTPPTTAPPVVPPVTAPPLGPLDPVVTPVVGGVVDVVDGVLGGLIG